MNWVRAITVTVAGLALGAVTACGAQDDGVSGAPVADQQVQPQANAQQAPLAKQAGVTKKLAVADAAALGAHWPARSTIAVAALPLGAAVEIEAIVHLPQE